LSVIVNYCKTFYDDSAFLRRVGLARRGGLHFEEGVRRILEFLSLDGMGFRGELLPEPAGSESDRARYIAVVPSSEHKREIDGIDCLNDEELDGNGDWAVGSILAVDRHAALIVTCPQAGWIDRNGQGGWG
jgi:hypothetical protein